MKASPGRRPRVQMIVFNRIAIMPVNRLINSLLGACEREAKRSADFFLERARSPTYNGLAPFLFVLLRREHEAFVLFRRAGRAGRVADLLRGVACGDDGIQ